MKKMEQYGLSANTIKKLQQIFSRFPMIQKVVLYGSRAKGNYRTGSDIDLTLYLSTKVANRVLFDVMDALDDLDSPYTCDISLYHQIDNPTLIAHINRVGIELYPKCFSSMS